MEQALAIRKKVHGEEHPDVAQSLNNLAWLLKDQGQIDDAKIMMRQAIDMVKKALGDGHRDVAYYQGKLGAILLRENPDSAEGAALSTAALAVLRHEHGLPASHPWIVKLRAEVHESQFLLL